jgi:hypothetical protein
MKGVKKQHLPSKICTGCGLPFAWRRKWERAWDEVKFCSERCRQNRKKSAPAGSSGPEVSQN